MLGRCEKSSASCYNIFCFCHRVTFRLLTKYCYFETVMQSLSFSAANREMFRLRQRAKGELPEIYMMGNFYITLAKIFSVMCGLILCYFLMAHSDASQIFSQPINLLGPLVAVFFASLEISNHFMNSTGLMGDTVVFAYIADVEIEKHFYSDSKAYSCPESVSTIINGIRENYNI
jgi:hypothetical protein